MRNTQYPPQPEPKVATRMMFCGSRVHRPSTLTNLNPIVATRMVFCRSNMNNTRYSPQPQPKRCHEKGVLEIQQELIFNLNPKAATIMVFWRSIMRQTRYPPQPQNNSCHETCAKRNTLLKLNPMFATRIVFCGSNIHNTKVSHQPQPKSCHDNPVLEIQQEQNPTPSSTSTQKLPPEWCSGDPTCATPDTFYNLNLKVAAIMVFC